MQPLNCWEGGLHWCTGHKAAPEGQGNSPKGQSGWHWSPQLRTLGVIFKSLSASCCTSWEPLRSSRCLSLLRKLACAFVYKCPQRIGFTLHIYPKSSPVKWLHKTTVWKFPHLGGGGGGAELATDNPATRPASLNSHRKMKCDIITKQKLTPTWLHSFTHSFI